MSYLFNDNLNQNEIYENEFFYSLGLEFPLAKKVYTYKNKVSYSKEKKIWFIRYKENDNYIYLFGYNYGSDKQLDTKDPLLILKFNLFNAPNIGNGHFAEDNSSDEVRAVMNIQYKNYRSTHKSENLKSISPIVVNSDNYLDLGNIQDSKELCKNIEILLDEIESIFFFNRYLNRIKNDAPIKNNIEIEKKTHTTVKIKKEKNNLPENTKGGVVETPTELTLGHTVKTINCDFCGSEILNNDPFKICKACRIKISNYLDLLCGDFEINTEIPLENLLHKAEEHNLSRNDAENITKTLVKYKYLHKINEKFIIDYNTELRAFIDKYSTKSENKNDSIENKVTLITEKIGLNTPFDIAYLKEALNFKNSEISKMIKYLDEKNAIIEDGEYFILVDKSNEINGINDKIKGNDIKSENEIKTSQEKTTGAANTKLTSIKTNDEKVSSIDEESSELSLKDKLTENNPQNQINSADTSYEKPIIELKPINIKNKTDREIFYELYEKVLTLMENNVQLEEIAIKLGIKEARLSAWIKKGKNGQNPYRLLSDGIKKINETQPPTINDYKWKKIIEDVKSGFNVFEVANRANIPYPVLQFHLTKGKQGKEGYKKYYEDYQNALNNDSHTSNEIKTHNVCQICNELFSDKSKVICKNCESKKNFAIDLKNLMEKLKYNTQFTNENLIIYYNDNEIFELTNKLKQYDLVLEDKSMHIFYFKKENVENFLNTYLDSKDSDYKIESKRTTDLVKEKTKKPKKIILSKSQNIPYQFTGLNNDHTFLYSSGSSSKFTLEDVILIHENYYEDLYSVDEIAKKMGLSNFIIKKIIVRFNEGDFDKFIKILEDEKENKKDNISVCKNCKKEFYSKENEEYCKNCIIISRNIGKNKFNIILQTKPEIIIGTVTDKNFANELCSIGTTELSNEINFKDVIDNLKEIIAEKRQEEIREIINDENIAKYEDDFKRVSATNSSKIKIITSMKKELITSRYIKLTFAGKLPNNKIDSSVIELLNEFKATKRELKLIPLNKSESEIIFYIITKNSLTITNMEILKKYNWYLEI